MARRPPFTPLTPAAAGRTLTGGGGVYLAVHPAQPTLLNDEVTGRLQEVGAEVALLDVIVLIAAVSGPGPGPDTEREAVQHFNVMNGGNIDNFLLL